MIDFTTQEISMLTDDGYFPAWMKDVQEGDLVAIPPVMREPIFNDPERDRDRHKVRTFQVKSLFSMDGSFYRPETEEMVENRVVSFIGFDIDGLPRHESFGSSYPCFIKRERGQ